jgi:hypothetical protein
MERLVGVGRDEFRDIHGLDVVQDVGAHYFLLVGCAVAEVVSCGEVAAVLRVAFLLEW